MLIKRGGVNIVQEFSEDHIENIQTYTNLLQSSRLGLPHTSPNGSDTVGSSAGTPLLDGAQLVCCIPHDVFSGLKSGPFQGHFQLGEKPEVTGSHVGKVGSLTKHMCVVFGQETIKCEEWAGALS